MRTFPFHPSLAVVLAALALTTSFAACGTSSTQADAGIADDAGPAIDASTPTDSGTADATDASVPDDGGSDGGSLGVPSKVVAGANMTCVLYTSGRVLCFGGNDAGQLARGNTTDVGAAAGTMATLVPIDLGTGAVVKQLSAGSRHVCALLTTNKIKCWGSNNQGRLGLDDAVDRGDKPNQMGENLPTVNLGVGRTAIQVAAGSEWTCALLDNGQVKCWGRNVSGQLGLGVTTVFIGDEPGEMAALGTVNFGPGRTALEIAAGEQHTCARLDDESIKCWGGNGEGQLGVGDTLPRGRQTADMGANLPAVALGTGRKAKALWVGGFHNCAKLDDESVKCWGGGVAGQLGNGSTVEAGNTPGSMGDTLPRVDFGAGRKAVSMHLGQEFSCAVLDNGQAKCFGNNFFGQLGYGDTAKRGDAPNEMGDSLPAIDFGGRALASLGVGWGHTCGVFDDKKVRCWGDNVAGALGIGNRSVRGDQPGEMGSALLPADLP